MKHRCGRIDSDETALERPEREPKMTRSAADIDERRFGSEREQRLQAIDSRARSVHRTREIIFRNPIETGCRRDGHGDFSVPLAACTTHSVSRSMILSSGASARGLWRRWPTPDKISTATRVRGRTIMLSAVAGP